MSGPKRVLVAPLNWGLGHATRCIPVIRSLIDRGAEVHIGSDGDALRLLQMEFPGLPFHTLPSYHIRYAADGNLLLKMALQVPSILRAIRAEHHESLRICKENKINLVISDNRYGLWNPVVPSIFITHQLGIRPPHGLSWMTPFLKRMNFYYIRRFNECWIPDAEGIPNLSGELSHGFHPPFKTRFIGPLSRFEGMKTTPPSGFKYNLMVIASGPEPQRTQFEVLLRNQVNENNGKTLLVRGTFNHREEKEITPNLEIQNHLTADAMQQAIISSEMIVCRSGYSSIMDLATLGKNAILIPTPGQTEQEYLADYLMKGNIFFSMTQKKLNLHDAILKSKEFNGFTVPLPSGLDHALDCCL